MKNILRIFTVITVFTLAACSSDKKQCGENEYNNFDLYGVGKWDNAEDFILRRYYTRVDTITLRSPKVSVIIKTTDDNTDTSVKWKIDGVPYESIYVNETSNTGGVSVGTYFPRVEELFEYENHMVVEATVLIDNNTISRKATITEQSEERDVLSVDFGMTPLMVREEVDILRGDGRFQMREDGIGYENLAPHFLYSPTGKTLYIFENGLLAEVAEFPSTIFITGTDGENIQLDERFLSFLRRLEMPGYLIETISFTSEGILEGTYSWDREGILFTLHSRDDVFPEDPDLDDGEESGEERYLEHSIGISYKLL